MKDKIGAALIVGAGISGIQSALDLADSGYKVYLVDKCPSIGGTMAQLDKTFPTNDCSMCILAPKLVGAGRHHNIELITNAEVSGILGEPGNFKVKILKHARSVDEDKCTGCGACTQACPIRFVIKPKEKPTEAPDVRDKEDMDAIIEKHKVYEDPLIQIMLDINTKYRYLPKDCVEYISYALAIPLTRIYRVATFYSAFSLVPVGKYHFKVCVGTSCHVRGSREVLDAIRANIADTPEGLFSVQTVNCLGACAMGPVVVCNEEYHTSADPKKMEAVVNALKETEAEALAQVPEEEAVTEGGEA